ncbi:signal transduction histidine kinase/ligand-binding sensor domain-containing protein [Ereboglobus sp. PH5-10]|uniref:sensor histidine kinase n=1 Tax=Ereboglobus sp. PH5-10 TaxID=2940629 RepID=UPI002404A638|nr:sensor histidine kinase [Ereboglobus sp. PH5-10]MDF9827908.1 signal transduction histidine kinase/ligand-binding sensor domain-containing protein [Ereboglobus sp. PH5-10]
MLPLASHAPCILRAAARRIAPPVLLLAALLIGIAEAAAKTSPLRDEDFVFREWFVEDGLPHNVVSNLLRDPRGFLWVGTLGGLARFDGREFVKFNMPDEYMDGGYNIRGLAMEDEHTLLIITGGNKLVRLRDGAFELHPANALLEGLRPRDIAVEPDGTLWIGVGTTISSIVRWDGRGMKTFGADDGITGRGAHFCFVHDRQNNRMWISGADFFGWHDDAGLHRYEGEAGHEIIIAPARSGGLWIGAREHLARFENGIWSEVMSGDAWKDAGSLGIRDIFETVDGTVWIATRRDAVFRLVNGTLERVPLRYERILAITDDIDGNMWVGVYGGGLVRATPRNYALLNTAAGMPTDMSYSVCEDEEGALWCANQNGGLVRVKDGNVSVATLPNGKSVYISIVCADRNGRVWASTTGGLLWTTSKGQLNDNTQGGGAQKWILQRYEVPMRNVQTLFCASNGDLWISWDYTHLGFLRDGRLHTFKHAEGYPGVRVAGIAERRDGEIWVCLEQGNLLRLDKNSGKFVEETNFDDTRSIRLMTLFVDSHERIWLGTTHGLLLWRGEQSRFFTTADGLPDDIINQILEDGHGRLWISSRGGIFYVSLDQLLAAVDSPGEKIPATLLGRDENLTGISGMSGGQPMAWKGRDNRVWFVTYRGVIGFDPPKPTDARQPLRVLIDGISTNCGPLQITPPENTMRVPSGAAPMELHFTALNFSTPERTRVRRMLEGFDMDWIDTSNENIAIYPRLPPGRYVFRVQAGTAGGGMARQSEASLNIIVAAAWWQTWWARLLAVLAFAAIVALCARRVSNRILKQRLRRLEHEHALERERSRIARDLHDDLGSHITKIGFAADRLQRNHPELSREESLGRIITHSRQFSEDLHRIIWTVNPQNDRWHQLATYIAHYAQRHLADTGIICTVEGVDLIPDLPLTPEIQHHLLALTKEALNNMLKHSKADRVTIHLATHNGRFLMEIADNGCGFDTNAANTDGNGLANMRARMAEIDGSIKITSHPGHGTQIAVDVPLEYKPPTHLTNTP